MKSESPFNPGDLVAAYFRDSGHEDQELSCEQQDAFARDWCAEHHLVLTRVFRDEARKGSTVVGRQKFQEMMHYFRGEKGGHVPERGLIIWKFSRFARDQDDSQFYIADLRHRKYIVHSLMDNIPSGPMGRLFEAAIHWANEKYLTDLSEDVKRGLYHLVETYRCVPGVPPRGIRRVPVVIGLRRDGREHIAHRWEPDPDYIGRVQQAFELKEQGASLDTIRRETGLYKSINSFQTFFSNKIWIGVLEYGEIIIPDYCPAIITIEQFKRVQARLAEHAENQNVRTDHLHPRRKNSRFLLSGLVFCPRCGSAMSGFVSRDKHGHTSERYGCGRAKRRRDCDMPLVPKYALEQAVIDQLVDHILQPENIIKLLNEMQSQDAAARELYEGERAELATRLNGVRQGLDNVTNALEQAGNSPHLLKRLSVLEDSHAEWQAKLDTINGKLSELGLPNGALDQIPELVELAQHLRAALRTGDDPTRREILRGLVQKVAVDRYGKNIVGNLWHYALTEGGVVWEDTENKNPLTENQGISEYTRRRSRRRVEHSLSYKHGFVAKIKNRPR